MNDCKHDKRFGGVFGAKNGCVACQCEAEAAATRVMPDLIASLEALVQQVQDAGWHPSITEYARESIAKAKGIPEGPPSVDGPSAAECDDILGKVHYTDRAAQLGRRGLEGNLATDFD